MIYLIISIIFMLGTLSALYIVIRQVMLNGIRGGAEENIILIASISSLILMPLFSYGFYKIYSDNLSFFQVFGG